MELLDLSIRCVKKCDTQNADRPMDISLSKKDTESCQCDTDLNKTGHPPTEPKEQLTAKNPLLSFTLKAKKLIKLPTPEWVPSYSPLSPDILPQSNIQLNEPEVLHESNMKMKGKSTKLYSPKRETPSLKASPFYRHVYLSCTKGNCTMTFSERRVRDEHVLLKHQENPYACLLEGCDGSFPSKTQVEAHLTTQHRQESNWVCATCGRLFSTGVQLKLHFFNYHEWGKYDCTQGGCPFTASNRKSVYSHFHMHHSVVSETSNGKGSLENLTSYQMNREHAKIRTSAVLCWVEGCLQYQLNQVDLNEHLEVEHGIGHFRCSLEHCKETFHLKSNLMAHTQVAHDPHATWPCSKCCLDYKTAWDLHQHNVFHHHEGIYRCEKCPYIQKFRAQIVQHYDRDHL